MKELPYLRFYPSEWQSGKISAFGAKEQGVYLNLCMMAWNKGGAFRIEPDLLSKKLELSKDELDTIVLQMCRFELLISEGLEYRIKWIEEQFKSSEYISSVRSKAVQKRWQNQPQKHTNVLQKNTIVLQNDTKKDDKDKDKDKDIKNPLPLKSFNPMEQEPTIREIIKQAELVGEVVTEDEAGKFLRNYQAKGWIIGGSIIVDWRHKLKDWALKGKEIKAKNDPTIDNVKRIKLMS